MNACPTLFVKIDYCKKNHFFPLHYFKLPEQDKKHTLFIIKKDKK